MYHSSVRGPEKTCFLNGHEILALEASYFPLKPFVVWLSYRGKLNAGFTLHGDDLWGEDWARLSRAELDAMIKQVVVGGGNAPQHDPLPSAPSPAAENSPAPAPALSPVPEDEEKEPAPKALLSPERDFVLVAPAPLPP